MAHEPRLNKELRELLRAHRVAALGSCNPDGTPFVSMVPYAVGSDASIIIHVSALATHTRNLQMAPQVSLLIMQSEVHEEPVHALHRVTLKGNAAELVPEMPASIQARSAYLKRFPEAEPMTHLGDFRFFAIHVNSAHQVAGFGAARNLDAEAVTEVLHAAI
jgi:putative heme iron utilization protein